MNNELTQLLREAAEQLEDYEIRNRAGNFVNPEEFGHE